MDTRTPEAYGGGHVPGALNVGLGPNFATWAGTVIPPDTDMLLVVDRPSDVGEVIWELLRIGYHLPVGWLRGGMTAWRVGGRAVEHTPQATVHDIKDKLDRGEVSLVDVRQPAEWAAGHVPGATFITGAELPDRLREIPDDRPVAVTCSSGYRSSVAASELARNTDVPVLNMLGGMSAWKQAGYPTTTP